MWFYTVFFSTISLVFFRGIEPLEPAENWLRRLNESGTSEYAENADANYQYQTNITDENLDANTASDAKFLAFQIEVSNNATRYLNRANGSAKPAYPPLIYRQLKKLSKVGVRLDEKDATVYSRLKGNMSAVYSTTQVCSMNEHLRIDCSKKWSLNPELENVMRGSRNYDLLTYAWKAWHEGAGRPILNTYKEYVELSNKGARRDGFADTGAYWRFLYEDDHLQQTLEKLWYELLPLYEQLHTYVRRKLRVKYPGKFSSNAVPAHIFGNMWAQVWSNINDFVLPYPNRTSIDVTQAMLDQNYTAERMFHVADRFFSSMGLKKLPKNFWRKSMLEKPKDGRNVVCHASAWDFFRKDDVAIKMCTKIDMENLRVIHHEQGHVQYYLQYANQPYAFREGANPGFHEAIGDTIALSVSTPAYLEAIGLLNNTETTDEAKINYLFNLASEKIAFLPFGYLIDQWRWAVYNESVNVDDWNKLWWSLRFKYQGMVPPVARETGRDFDPGAKFHVPADSPYVHYFVAAILQFQFYEALCKAAGHSGPLHECNFYNNTDAGSLFSSVLSLGSSKHWREALKIITGKEEMSASSIINYFDPLIKWLKKENNNDCFGWGYAWPNEVLEKLSKPRCSS